MIRPDAVIDSARSWVGVPYKHQGRTRKGIDCVGLIEVTCRELGLLTANVIIATNYARRPLDGLLERITAEHCTQCESGVAGGLVLMRWTPRSPAAHCAVITGENIIHSYLKIGSVVEHGFRGAWPRLAHSFWKLPGVTYE